MKKVININFQGQVIAIEETAYELLKQYIDSLKKYFSAEDGGEEIVNDIENRIAELFGNRLKHGINCITDEDVQSIISNIGRPEEFDPEYNETTTKNNQTKPETPPYIVQNSTFENKEQTTRTLYRNSNDKIIAGVCSGLAHYFKIDPVWMRILFVLLFSMLFWVYLLLWIFLKPMPLQSNVTKRLYRNLNDRYLGGVCGGLATYFKIDAWIPRLLFIAPIILGMFGMISLPFFAFNDFFDNFGFNWDLNFGFIVVYIVLWIIIPKATTVKQKLEMMGEEEYIKSLRETVSGNIAQAKNKSAQNDANAQVHFASVPENSDNANTPDTPPVPPVPPTRTKSVKQENSSETPNRSGCLNAMGILAKIIFFAFAGIFVLSLLLMLLVFVFAGAQFVPLKSLFIDSGLENNLLWLLVILSVGVPVAATILWIIRRSLKAKSHPVIGAIATVLWIVGIFCGLALSLRVANKYTSENYIEKNIQLNPIANNVLYVEPVIVDADLLQFKGGIGRNNQFDELPFYNEQKDSLFFDDIDVRIVDSKDSLFHVNTISRSYDKDEVKAKNNIRQFTYSIQQKDSVLLLPTYFATPMQQGYRLQRMEIEIAVPKGKKVEISPEIENLHSTNLRSGRSSFFDDFGEDFW